MRETDNDVWNAYDDCGQAWSDDYLLLRLAGARRTPGTRYLRVKRRLDAAEARGVPSVLVNLARLTAHQSIWH